MGDTRLEPLVLSEDERRTLENWVKRRSAWPGQDRGYFLATEGWTCQHDEAGRPYRSFRGLLDHLGTLTRNDLRFPGTTAAVPVLTDPTSEQRQAFDLIEAAIPLTLRK